MTTGYYGEAMWVRIHSRFGPRMSEWFMAAHMSVFGLVLLAPSSTFNQPAYEYFRDIIPGNQQASEIFLGWLMFSVGLVRFGGLIINGARKQVTPQIRQASAAIGCMVWVGVTYGFWASDVFSTWLAIYPIFAIKELVNLHRASVDEGEARVGSTH